MHYRRIELDSQRVLSAQKPRTCRNEELVRTVGCVIARQRPGIAKGFIFLSLEDETGIANIVITPDLHDQDRLVVIHGRFLLVEGSLQNQDGVIHVKVQRLLKLSE